MVGVMTQFLRGAALACITLLLLATTVSDAAAQNGRYNLFLQEGTVRDARLPAGQSVTVQTSREIGDIVVGNPDIADVSPLTETSIYLLGKQIGRTTVTIYDLQKKPLGVIQVEIGVDVTDLGAALRQHLPGENISVTTINGRVRLGGTVTNGQSLATALELARQYAGDNIINALKVTESQQVMLEVRFLEATRSSGRDLRVSNSAMNGRNAGARSGNIGFSEDTVVPGTITTEAEQIPVENLLAFVPSFVSPNAAFGSIVAKILNTGGLDIDIFIEATEQRGLTRVLAEPNLIALSGETASFLAGGEFPLPVVNDDGEVTVTFKEFGVRLSFTPIVLDDGLINLKLQPEVSELDFAASVDTGAGTIPGLTVRRTTTTIELRDGQSFSIAGLLSSRNRKNQRQLPWVGQLPIIGTLFRSSSFQKDETDLVVIVTPRLVKPAEPGEELRSPLDRTYSANDPEFFLLGLMEVDREQIRKFALGEGIVGPYGHILDFAPEAQDVVKP